MTFRPPDYSLTLSSVVTPCPSRPQSGRQLRDGDGHEGGHPPGRPRALAGARLLQELLLHRRHLLPLRPAGVLHEVRVLDLQQGRGECNHGNSDVRMYILVGH